MNASELASIKRQAYINAGLNYRTVESIFGSPSDADLQNSDWIDALYRDGRMSVYDISLSGEMNVPSFFFQVHILITKGKSFNRIIPELPVG